MLTGVTRNIGRLAGILAIGMLTVASLPTIALWLLAALLLDIADGGLLA